MSDRDLDHLDQKMGPPPVESLSDVSWQRVEKGLFTALDQNAGVGWLDDGSRPVPLVSPRRNVAVWVGAAVALAAAVAFYLVTRPAPTHPHAKPPQPEISRVVTQDTPSEITFGEATIAVDAQSAVTMQGSAASGVLVVLERGAATFAVAPRGQRPPLMVQAGDVTVRVIGTRFMVSRSGDAARVDVIEGHVEVVAKGRRVQVRAGESWSSSDDWEAVAGGQAATTGDVAAAPLSDASATDEEENPEGRNWEAPSSAGAAAGSDEERSRPRQRNHSPVDARTRYERAAALEPTDPQAALVAYRSIAKGKGAWAGNALFAAGRLAAELGEPAAKSLLEDYLARFPDGANAADAKRLLRKLK